MSFLKHFENVAKVNGDGQYQAQCPAHEDTRQSLCIKHVEDCWLLYCQAGCWTGQILGLARLDWNDLFDTPDTAPTTAVRMLRPRRNRQDMSGEAFLPPAHIIDYWHQQLTPFIRGRLLEAKGWSRETVNIFCVGWDGVRLVLPVYRFGELVGLVRYLPGGNPKVLAIGARELYPDSALMDSRDPAVFLVEGEPDAISMTELGLNAIALPGASKWMPDWAGRFTGFNVSVLLDCDDAGRIAAERVRDELANQDVACRIVDLDPSRNDGFDVGDALRIAHKQRRVGDLRAYLERLREEAWST